MRSGFSATADTGNVQLASISGVKFEDLNGNGVRDLNEPGIAGWTIFLDRHAPVAAGEAYNTPEDTPLTVAAPGVLGNDSDVDGDALSAILVQGPAHGTLAFQAGGGFTYTPAANFNGSDSFTYKANDGSLDSNVATVALTITPVNNGPVNTVPGSQSIDEDTALVFSNSNGNRISITDIGAGTHAVRVALTATNGALTLGGRAGLTFTAGDGVADGTMTFTGTLSSINAALDGLRYAPAANYNGPASLTVTTSDLSNTGAGVPLTAANTVAITVRPVNDGPANTVPGSQTINEDTALVFSSSNGKRISITDVDAGTNPVQVALTAAHGALTLVGTAGLTFTAGDGVADGSMTFTGTLTAINTALEGLRYAPAANYNGSDSLTITTNDLGNTGAGGPLTATNTVAITVRPVNDAPVNTVPGSQSIDEDAALVFSSSNGNRISITDVDAGTNPVRVALTATHGTLTLSGTAGLTFTAGDGVADGSMTFTGTLTAINAALEGLCYAPAANYNGSASLTLTTNDRGNTGAGGSLTAANTVAITVRPVDDAPVAAGEAYTTTEDKVLTMAASRGVLRNDTDVERETLSAVLVSGPAHGTLTLNAQGGFTYTPAANFNGSDSFTYKANDGSLDSNVATVALTITPVDDAPVNTVPGSQTIDEDTALVFSSSKGNRISIADVDAGTNPVRVTLTANNGGLTLAGRAGLTFTVGDGVADGTMTFTGTLSSINAALDGLRYAPAANYNGPASLTVTTSDLSNTGAGVPLTAVNTVAITVRPVNDAPVAAPDAASVVQNTAVIINVLANDRDVEGDLLSVTSFTQPKHGTVVQISNGIFAYGSRTGYTGTDSFTYTISDGHGKTSTATVTLDCQPATPGSTLNIEPGGGGGGALQASGKATVISGTGGAITAEALTATVAEAEALWGQAVKGATLRLEQVEFKIADLPGQLLGHADGNTVVLDGNAAGYGWFIDSTPADNQEFSRRTATGELFAAPGSPAFGEMDLLTVVMHELGHVLGLEHQAQGVMEAALDPGERLVLTDYADKGGATAALAAPTAKPQTWVFDELRGEFLGAGTKYYRGENNLSFNYAAGDGMGSSQNDNGSDWLILTRRNN